ncbi:hypothetical protein E2C01_093659 [Portunus trituberculatus]|uniref:Uncharacterized protein n=1 Tax=Portunus trituberculatus TaxID=210409 RepID=A0A5B7JVE9_PORTR|nr:hypothetical protein [Portunus trituberculatus]
MPKRLWTCPESCMMNIYQCVLSFAFKLLFWAI